jgi:hypothetical protein
MQLVLIAYRVGAVVHQRNYGLLLTVIAVPAGAARLDRQGSSGRGEDWRAWRSARCN